MLDGAGLLISISGEDCIGSTNAFLGIDTVVEPCLKKAQKVLGETLNHQTKKSKRAREREKDREREKERERGSQMLTSDVCFRETPLSAG